MSSMPMRNSNSEQEVAIKEVGRGYDIIKQLQYLLQLKSRKGGEAIPMHELAETLFREALQSLNHALCIMRSGVTKVEIKSDMVVIESDSPAHSSHESVTSYNSDQRSENGRGKRRRVGESSWINNTSMPYDDGYQWRKYGDKKISGSDFPRSYFRCTYKEQGCQAKKLVQQTTNKLDMPLFQVTYTNKHTCNFHNTTPLSSSPQPSPFGSIQQSSINHMPHLQEYQPSGYQLLNQVSCSGDANNLSNFASTFIVEGNWEWDLDSLLKDLVGFTS
ncbi:hypothetical protein LUZ61_013390 [Rhynchospora tenuis]|uniref:WRKY domain-containing protein n=1 Tax=Rhynchospora tenuis TaxID=198213 RepID=A0AAD5W904_9POAL|nr:hypothetical protein LUZ61_013390 [Rhynchospora tenuis]